MVEQEILEMLTTMVEDKDIYTAGHSKRVAMYSARIANEMGLSEADQTTVYQAGLLHDIGKILTPESILLKPKKYNRQEFNIMKNHSADGEKMVLFISSFKEYATIIRHHHERFDGEGYPDGLSGEAIPLLSRIMCVADSFDAMTTNRIYKARKTIDDAIVELKKCAGKQFDPLVVEHALSVLGEFKTIIDSNQNPKNGIDEERFAYFFKDPLTGAYSSEYLNHFLRRNKEITHYCCCYFVQLHHMKHYNERFGYKCGDDALKEVALRMRVLFNSSLVFRVFGDDFIVLNTSHYEVVAKEIVYKLSVGFEGLSASLEHFDFRSMVIDSWESLENHLVHCD